MYRIPQGLTVGDWIRQLFRDHGNARNFYRSREWAAVRDKVLRDAHWECADCKAQSPAKYSRATIVHHERYVRKYPDEALTISRMVDGHEVRQLVPL